MGYTTQFQGSFIFTKSPEAKVLKQIKDLAELHSPGSRAPDMPGSWCQWILNDKWDGICWDGGEKFYLFIEWAQYILDKILKPAGIGLAGVIQYRGEEFSDMGDLVVDDGKISTRPFGRG